MVAPYELVHASYALPVMKHLATTFSGLTFLTFRERLFPDLSQEVLESAARLAVAATAYGAEPDA